MPIAVEPSLSVTTWSFVELAPMSFVGSSGGFWAGSGDACESINTMAATHADSLFFFIVGWLLTMRTFPDLNGVYIRTVRSKA